MSNVPRSSDGTSVDQSFCTKRGLHAQLARERRRQVDLEAAQLVGVRRILVDVRLAALAIAAPAQLAGVPDALERALGRGAAVAARDQRGGRAQRQANGGAGAPPPHAPTAARR